MAWAHLLPARGLRHQHQLQKPPNLCLPLCKPFKTPCYMTCSSHSFGRPGPEAGILLSTFDFANANKVFCFNLISLQSEKKTEASPLSGYLSLTSYLFQHAHRSARASLYSYLSLFILQIVVEDQVLMKRLCSEDNKLVVRLCRQRQPYLPVVKVDRIPATVVLDLVVDGINHNLRRRLDMNFYMLVTSHHRAFFG